MTDQMQWVCIGILFVAVMGIYAAMYLATRDRARADHYAARSYQPSPHSDDNRSK